MRRPEKIPRSLRSINAVYNILRAKKWQNRLPRIYNLQFYPWFTRNKKKDHFGQFVPLEGVENVLDRVDTVHLATLATARTEIRDLDKKGMSHSVWTFNTPYISAICNCDQDCTAYQIHYRWQLAEVMEKIEYVANIDADRCRGCKLCRKQCVFDVINYDRTNAKYTIEITNCYGCGI